MKFDTRSWHTKMSHFNVLHSFCLDLYTYVVLLPCCLESVPYGRVIHLSANHTQRCLTSDGRVNHITRKASSLERVLISRICLITTLFGSFVPKLRSWFPWTTERLLLQWTTPYTRPMDNLRQLHQYHSIPTGHPNCPGATSFFTAEQWRCISLPGDRSHRCHQI